MLELDVQEDSSKSSSFVQTGSMKDDDGLMMDIGDVDDGKPKKVDTGNLGKQTLA